MTISADRPFYTTAHVADYATLVKLVFVHVITAQNHVAVNLSPGLLACRIIMSVHRDPWDPMPMSTGNASAGDLQSQFVGLNVGAMPFVPNINAQPFVPGGPSAGGYRHSQPYYQHGMGKWSAFIRKFYYNVR